MFFLGSVVEILVVMMNVADQPSDDPRFIPGSIIPLECLRKAQQQLTSHDNVVSRNTSDLPKI
jgi:hypothetical protein